MSVYCMAELLTIHLGLFSFSRKETDILFSLTHFFLSIGEGGGHFYSLVCNNKDKGMGYLCICSKLKQD